MFQSRILFSEIGMLSHIKCGNFSMKYMTKHEKSLWFEINILQFGKHVVLLIHSLIFHKILHFPCFILFLFMKVASYSSHQFYWLFPCCLFFFLVLLWCSSFNQNLFGQESEAIHESMSKLPVATYVKLPWKCEKSTWATYVKLPWKHE